MHIALLLPDDHFPKFDVGDPVVIFDPRVKNDGWVFDDMDAPKHGTIKRVEYVDHLGIFAYQLEEYSGWYNEAWLHDDEYLPMMVEVKARAERIDALLDEYNDYKRLADEFGDGEYAEKLAEIKSKLAMISAG